MFLDAERLELKSDKAVMMRGQRLVRMLFISRTQTKLDCVREGGHDGDQLDGGAGVANRDPLLQLVQDPC